ncbi:hypothetical protein BURMUCGD1_2827 [Burkholderia multivorans CGD1]|nr:hypothetical protein BURMUCGD1_2827 [Burkholderia multivorans CGD1]
MRRRTAGRPQRARPLGTRRRAFAPHRAAAAPWRRPPRRTIGFAPHVRYTRAFFLASRHP